MVPLHIDWKPLPFSLGEIFVSLGEMVLSLQREAKMVLLFWSFSSLVPLAGVLQKKAQTRQKYSESVVTLGI